jgi:hypothetical protein
MARPEVGGTPAHGADEVLDSVVGSISPSRRLVEASLEDLPDEVGASPTGLACASIDALHQPFGKAKADLPSQCHDISMSYPTCNPNATHPGCRQSKRATDPKAEESAHTVVAIVSH